MPTARRAARRRPVGAAAGRDRRSAAPRRSRSAGDAPRRVASATTGPGRSSAARSSDGCLRRARPRTRASRPRRGRGRPTSIASASRSTSPRRGREEMPLETVDAVLPDADVDGLGLGGDVGAELGAAALGTAARPGASCPAGISDSTGGGRPTTSLRPSDSVAAEPSRIGGLPCDAAAARAWRRPAVGDRSAA